jgi:hypothetical protein
MLLKAQAQLFYCAGLGRSRLQGKLMEAQALPLIAPYGLRACKAAGCGSAERALRSEFRAAHCTLFEVVKFLDQSKTPASSDRIEARGTAGGRSMIVIKMPGGGLEYVNAGDILWMRNAFPSEWKGAVMIRIGSDRLYSIETLEELRSKLAGDGVRIATFSPPEGKLQMLVNAKNVREVEPGNPIIYHEKARAVLVFSFKVKLAVRETPEEAAKLISTALA